MLKFLLAETGASTWILPAVLLVMIIAMFVLPGLSNKKKIAAYREMQDGLKAGDKIQTIGGIVGRIVRVNNKDGYKTIVLETGDKNSKMHLELDINAIAGIVTGLPNTSPATSSSKVEETSTEQEQEIVEPEIVDISFDEPAEKSTDEKTTQNNSKKNKKR